MNCRINQMRGTPPPQKTSEEAWKEHYRLQEQYIDELEREIDRLKIKILSLTEAGDKMLRAWLMPEDSMPYTDWVCLSSDAKRGWRAAKEAKP